MNLSLPKKSRIVSRRSANRVTAVSSSLLLSRFVDRREHWDHVGAMANPAGYLYRVGQTAARKARRTGPLAVPVDHVSIPDVEIRRLAESLQVVDQATWQLALPGATVD